MRPNEHLYEGRYSPTNARGKRETHNIYADAREECEEKLAVMIAQKNAEIAAEKERLGGRAIGIKHTAIRNKNPYRRSFVEK